MDTYVNEKREGDAKAMDNALLYYNHLYITFSNVTTILFIVIKCRKSPKTKKLVSIFTLSRQLMGFMGFLN